MLKFEIPSTRTINEDKTDKKYVLYVLCVRLDGVQPDPNPTYIHRRYTNFENLYNSLKTSYPLLMANVNFPKKVMIGNFNPDLIYCRSSGFSQLLTHIANDPRLREAPATVSFFQDIELAEAKGWISEQKYDQALVVLENMFTLLNKVYTDRSRVVLVTLCRVVACGIVISDKGDEEEDPSLAGPIERFAKLALHRFDAVSDTDLLSLYVPLIKTCVCIWRALGKNTEELESKLEDMKKKGMRVDDCLRLGEAVDKLVEENDIV